MALHVYGTEIPSNIAKTHTHWVTSRNRIGLMYELIIHASSFAQRIVRMHSSMESSPRSHTHTRTHATAQIISSCSYRFKWLWNRAEKSNQKLLPTKVDHLLWLHRIENTIDFLYQTCTRAYCRATFIEENMDKSVRLFYHNHIKYRLMRKKLHYIIIKGTLNLCSCSTLTAEWYVNVLLAKNILYITAQKCKLRDRTIHEREKKWEEIIESTC